MNKYVRYSWIVLCVIAQIKASTPSESQPTLKTAQSQNAQQQSQSKMHAMNNQQTPPSIGQTIVAGTVAGVTEVALAGQVLSYFVNRKVQGDRFTAERTKWSVPGYISLYPRDVYRGIVPSAVGMGAITCKQVVGTAVVQEKMEQELGRDLAGVERLVPPLTAGAVAGAAVATPQEGIPNYQQNVKAQEGREISGTQAVREMQAKYGFRAPWRGAFPTLCRDSKFVVGYKVLPAMAQEQMTPYFGNNLYTQWMSKIGAGVATAVVTHPWNVVARHMQNNRQLSNTMTASSDLYAKEGFSGFTKGIVPRGARVSIAIPVLSWAEVKALALLKYANSNQGK